jgi:YD repeat-containing protein
VPGRGGDGLSDQQGREVLEEPMKVSYDKTSDTLSMILKDNTPIAESDEDKPGVILDYDAAGNLVSIEILDASKRVTEARKVEFQTTG